MCRFCHNQGINPGHELGVQRFSSNMTLHYPHLVWILQVGAQTHQTALISEATTGPRPPLLLTSCKLWFPTAPAWVPNLLNNGSQSSGTVYLPLPISYKGHNPEEPRRHTGLGMEERDTQLPYPFRTPICTCSLPRSSQAPSIGVLWRPHYVEWRIKPLSICD